MLVFALFAKTLRLLHQGIGICLLATSLLLAPSLQAQETVTTPLASTWPATALTGNQVENGKVQAGYLLDKTGKLDIMDMLQRQDFVPADPYHAYTMGSDGAIWLRLRLQIPLDGNQQSIRGSDLTSWVLEIPVPLLDDVQLYQMGSDQRLQAVQRAGDLLANQQWSYPSNTSAFKLNLYAGESNDVWLRVQYPITTQLPILLKTERQYLHDSRALFWAMGGVFGALLFLCLYVGLIVLIFRDVSHLAFGLYMGSSLATLFSYSGINGYFLFRSTSTWTDVSTGIWQLLSAATALFFAGTLLQAPLRAPRLTWLMRGIGIFCLLAIPFYVVLDRTSIGAPLVMLGLFSAYATCSAMGIIAARAGDSTGRIIAIFFACLIINFLLSVAGAAGWLRFFWYQQAPVYILMMVMLPIILAAMNFKMRHQLAMQIRAQGIRSHDALTDTLNEPFFISRVRTFMTTPRKRKNAALVLIDVSNLAFMRENFPQEVIEQTLLRAVIKIKRIFGDMDAIGRIGDNRLAVLMENTDRERVSKLAVELIASGLMPAKNLKQDISIIFHFGVAMLEHYEGHLDEMLPALQKLCDKMSPRTQRPIRYLGDASSSSGRRSGNSGHDAPSSTQMPNSSYTEQPASGFSHSQSPSRPLSGIPNSSGHSSAGAPPSSSFHR